MSSVSNGYDGLRGIGSVIYLVPHSHTLSHICVNNALTRDLFFNRND